MSASFAVASRSTAGTGCAGCTTFIKSWNSWSLPLPMESSLGESADTSCRSSTVKIGPALELLYHLKHVTSYSRKKGPCKPGVTEGMARAHCP